MSNVAILFYRTLSSQSAASLSAGYIAAYLRKQGHTVKLFLLDKGAGTDDTGHIDFTGFDAIFYKPNFKDIDRLVTNLKSIKKVILFGPYAFLNSTHILNTFPEVFAILKPNHEAHVVLEPDERAFVLREKKEERAQIINPIANIWPARDIEETENLKIANIEASRGCVNRCAFCHIGLISKMLDSPVFTRDMDDLWAEIKSLKRLGKKYVIFNDSVLAGGGKHQKKWLKDLRSKAEESPYFMAYMTLNNLTEPSLIELLSETNFIRIFVGIETVSKESLHGFSKDVKFDQYAAIKKKLHKHFIIPHIGFMLFHPYTSRQEIKDGLTYLYEYDELHRFGVVNEATRVIYNSALYLRLMRDGLLKDKSGIYDFKDKEVGQLYEKFIRTFKQIDVPLLERIEHLFVTGEFIDNLVRRLYSPDEKYMENYAAVKKIRKRYSRHFFELCMKMVEKKAIDAQAERTFFMNLWQDLEDHWQELIIHAKATGFTEPLEWIASGNCSPEPDKTKGYDGRSTKTRSGEIKL